MRGEGTASGAWSDPFSSFFPPLTARRNQTGYSASQRNVHAAYCTVAVLADCSQELRVPPLMIDLPTIAQRPASLTGSYRNDQPKNRSCDAFIARSQASSGPSATDVATIRQESERAGRAAARAARSDAFTGSGVADAGVQ